MTDVNFSLCYGCGDCVLLYKLGNCKICLQYFCVECMTDSEYTGNCLCVKCKEKGLDV